MEGHIQTQYLVSNSKTKKLYQDGGGKIRWYFGDLSLLD